MQKQALHNIQLEQRQLCLNDNLCHPKSFFSLSLNIFPVSPGFPRSSLKM